MKNNIKLVFIVVFVIVISCIIMSCEVRLLPDGISTIGHNNSSVQYGNAFLGIYKRIEKQNISDDIKYSVKELCESLDRLFDIEKQKIFEESLDSTAKYCDACNNFYKIKYQNLDETQSLNVIIDVENQIRIKLKNVNAIELLHVMDVFENTNKGGELDDNNYNNK